MTGTTQISKFQDTNSRSIQEISRTLNASSSAFAKNNKQTKKNKTNKKTIGYEGTGLHEDKEDQDLCLLHPNTECIC